MKGPRDDIGRRMKENYELRTRFFLPRRIPAIIRIDGKAFHTFCREFDKPFDFVMTEAMAGTMLALCRNIQGCVFGYTQSDEISLCLVDYKKISSDAFMDYNVQKMVSISASMATMEFNCLFSIFAADKKHAVKAGLAIFDSRCFSISVDEVANYFYWRQLDATRNSINALGQANFPHKALQGKSCSDIQDMLVLEKGINWNNLPAWQKRGMACARDADGGWVIDRDIPIFKGDGRNCIESRLLPEE